jgi:hypothetical protein
LINVNIFIVMRTNEKKNSSVRYNNEGLTFVCLL